MTPNEKLVWAAAFALYATAYTADSPLKRAAEAVWRLRGKQPRVGSMDEDVEGMAEEMRRDA